MLTILADSFIRAAHQERRDRTRWTPPHTARDTRSSRSVDHD